LVACYGLTNTGSSGSVEQTQLVYVYELLGFTVMCYPLALDVCTYLCEYPLP